ncbi:hypothetical protein [Microbacterium sp.]|uniref:hypothetical protein n=1 Tax=Microbacterium sp. TaxID=51671 RepID=UPI003564678A
MRIVTVLLAGIFTLSFLTACAPVSDDDPSVSAPSSPSSKPTTSKAATPKPVPTYDVPDIEVYPNKPTSTDLSCADAVATAAAVPGAEDNNDEVYVTLIACNSVEEWGAAVVANPGVFAMSSVPSSEIDFYTKIVCSGADETPVCSDAVARGIL